MDLTSPVTLISAWLLVPLLVIVVSLGLGAWLELAAGRPLGPLVIPAGFAGGMVLIPLALQLGLGGLPTIVLTGLIAVVGCLLAARGLRAGRGPDRREWLAAGSSGAFAYAVGMAPLAGSGRSGVLGYVFNNDPTVHLSVVELLRRQGATVGDSRLSSFDIIASQFANGYPLGSYAWPLFGRVATGVDPFHLWTPLIALALSLLALVMFSALRSLGAGRIVAGAGGALVGSGYLPLSYLSQGGAKEVEAALVIYASIVLATTLPLRTAGVRALVPAAVCATAGVYVLGLASAAYLGPAALFVAALLIAAVPAARRRRLVIGLSAATAVAAVAALPALASSIRFAQNNEDAIADPAQYGNLVGPVPWREAFNVWLAPDYRFPVPHYAYATDLLIAVAALLAAIGVVAALRRRAWLVPVAVGAALTGTLVISTRYAIYFDAKAYMLLAPALGLATTAGAAALIGARGRAFRAVGWAAGGTFAAGVLASAAMVYTGVWITPNSRFEELGHIAKRLDGQGPVLVHEREEYGFYVLRGSEPWETWGAWQPDRGLRVPGAAPGLPRTPDFDDYKPEFIAKFPLLLERRRPGGSRPPANYRVAFETPHYRVWKREGPAPKAHLPLGIDTLTGVAPLSCDAPEVEAVVASARAEDLPIRVSFGRPRTVFVGTDEWTVLERDRGSLPGFVAGRGGMMIISPRLEAGSYAIFLQGSVGPGVRLYYGESQVGEAFGDLGLHDEWLRLGSVDVGEDDPDFLLTGLEKPAWQAGSRHTDLLGTMAFVPQSPRPRVEVVSPRELKSLCGRQLDWVELG